MNEKKKLLLVLTDFDIGGIQKAAIAFLNEFRADFDITVFAFKSQGPLRKEVPSDIPVLDCSERFSLIGETLSGARAMGFKEFATRLRMALHSRFFGNQDIIAKACEDYQVPGDYDFAVSFVQAGDARYIYLVGTPYFTLHCVKAKTKIQVIHDDMHRKEYRTRENGKLYSGFDGVFVFSEDTKKLCESIIKAPCFLFNNFYDVAAARNAFDEAKRLGPFDQAYINLISLSRLSPEKGMSRLIECLGKADSLITRAYTLRIYGDGVEKNRCLSLIRKYELENKVILMDPVDRPIVPLLRSDALVVASYDEAHPMVVDEAHMAGKPVFAASYSSASAQLYPTDTYVDNTDAAFQNGIVWFINGFSRKADASSSLYYYQEKNQNIKQNLIDIFYSLKVHE